MKLIGGKGSLKDGACWMSALNYYTTYGSKAFQWSDHPNCVDPVIQRLCIWLNDFCHDGEREQIIGPHLFSPVGTNQSAELTKARRWKCADVAMRRFAPIWFDRAKMHKEAEMLRNMPKVTEANYKEAKEICLSAKDAAAAAAAAYAAAAYAAAAYAAAAYAAAAAAAAAYAAAAAAAAYAAAAAAAAAYAAAAYAAAAYAAARIKYREETIQMVLDLILELCAMGSSPVEEACTKVEVLECLETGFSK